MKYKILRTVPLYVAKQPCTSSNYLIKNMNINKKVVAKGFFKPTFNREGSEEKSIKENKSIFLKKRSRPINIQTVYTIHRRPKYKILKKNYDAFPENFSVISNQKIISKIK